MKSWIPYVVGLLLAVAGVAHFSRPQVYLRMMPSFLPAPTALNYAAGLLEILLGFMLFFPLVRPLAAAGIAFLMVLFLPVHFSHLFSPPFAAPFWVFAARFFLQFAFIVGAWRMRDL